MKYSKFIFIVLALYCIFCVTACIMPKDNDSHKTADQAMMEKAKEEFYFTRCFLKHIGFPPNSVPYGFSYIVLYAPKLEAKKIFEDILNEEPKEEFEIRGECINESPSFANDEAYKLYAIWGLYLIKEIDEKQCAEYAKTIKEKVPTLGGCIADFDYAINLIPGAPNMPSAEEYQKNMLTYAVKYFIENW